jgi:hypothetical protein
MPLASYAKSVPTLTEQVYGGYTQVGKPASSLTEQDYHCYAPAAPSTKVPTYANGFNRGGIVSDIGAVSHLIPYVPRNTYVPSTPRVTYVGTNSVPLTPSTSGSTGLSSTRSLAFDSKTAT